MKVHLSKNTIVTLYGFVRQAERSIHFALSSPSQWAEFVAYFDEKRKSAISNLIEILKQAGAAPQATINRHSFSRNVPSALLRHVVGRLANKVKRSWVFTPNEITFLCSTFEHLLKAVDRPMPTDVQSMIELRLDFCECQEIIGWKMIGVPELKKANRIEHFNQSQYSKKIPLDDLVADSTALVSTR